MTEAEILGLILALNVAAWFVILVVKMFHGD